MTDLRRGAVVWFNADPVRGREQGGHRPGLVIASDGYLRTATTLTIVLPVTTTDRAWPNHVRLQGDLELEQASFAMTEQPRTIDRARVTSVAGHVDAETMHQIDRWLRVFVGL